VEGFVVLLIRFTPPAPVLRPLGPQGSAPEKRVQYRKQNPERRKNESHDWILVDPQEPNTQNHGGPSGFFRVMPQKNHLWFLKEPFKPGFWVL